MINKNTPFFPGLKPGKKSPNKISITLVADIGKHFHFSPEKLGLKQTKKVRTEGSNNMYEKFEKKSIEPYMMVF